MFNFLKKKKEVVYPVVTYRSLGELSGATIEVNGELEYDTSWCKGRLAEILVYQWLAGHGYVDAEGNAKHYIRFYVK